MFGANEPSARPTAHDRQPKMVVTRIPNLFRIVLETGPRKQMPPIVIDETHAAERNKVKLVVKLLLDIMGYNFHIEAIVSVKTRSNSVKT